MRLKSLLLACFIVMFCTGCNQDIKDLPKPTLTHIKTLDKFKDNQHLSTYQLYDGIFYFEETEDDVENQTMYTRKIYAYDIEKDKLETVLSIKDNIRVMDCLKYDGKLFYSYYIPSKINLKPNETRIAKLELGKEKIIKKGHTWEPFNTPTLRANDEGIYFVNLDLINPINNSFANCTLTYELYKYKNDELKTLNNGSMTIKDFTTTKGDFYHNWSLNVRGKTVKYTTNEDGKNYLYTYDKTWEKTPFKEGNYPVAVLKSGNLMSTSSNKDSFIYRDTNKKIDIDQHKGYYDISYLDDNSFLFCTEENARAPIYAIRIKNNSYQKLKIEVPNSDYKGAPGIFSDGKYSLIVTELSGTEQFIAYRVQF